MSQGQRKIVTLDAPKPMRITRCLKIKRVRTVGKPDGVSKEGTAIIHHGRIFVTPLTKIPEPEAPDMRPYAWFVRSQPDEIDEWEIYPEDISAQLEMALCAGMPCIRYINNNTEYQVDIATLKQYPVADPENAALQMDVERAPVEFVADAQTGILVPRRGFVKAPATLEAPPAAPGASPVETASESADAAKEAAQTPKTKGSKLAQMKANFIRQFKQSCGVYLEKVQQEQRKNRPQSPCLVSEGLPMMRMMVRASSNPIYALDAARIVLASTDANGAAATMATRAAMNCALTGGQSNRVLEWNYDNGELICEYRCSTSPTCVVHNVHYSPSTRCIAAATGNRDIALFMVGNSSPVKTISAHESIVYDANITALDEKVISIGMDGFVRMWNIDSSLCERAECPTTAPQLSMSIRESLPSLVLTTGGDGVASLVDFRCPIATVARLPVTEGPATGCALRMDGLQFATCGQGPIVRVWDMRLLNAPSMELNHYGENCTTVTYTPQQRALICTDDAGRSVMISLEDRSLIWRTHTHERAISRLVVNGFSKSIITGSLDGLVNVWHWGEADAW